MQNFLNNVVDPVVVTLITALVAYLLKIGLPFVVDALLKSKAATLVKAAESIFAGTGRGTEKYQYVADGLANYTKSLLIKIKDARIKGYIEAAVTQLHAELPAALSDVQKQIETAQPAAPAQTPTQKA